MIKGSKTGKPAWNSQPIIVTCGTCKKEFRTKPSTIKNGGGKFCNKACYLKDHAMKFEMIICKGCGKEIKTIKAKKQTCCSLSCNMKWRIKLYDLDKREIKACLQCGKERLINPSRMRHNRDKYCSKKCYGTWLSINRRGALAPYWKGGITPFYKAVRLMSKYKIWRKSVFERDNYTCQLCGTFGGDLQVDHIVGLFEVLLKNNITTTQEANNCDMLWDINNGRVLCIPCHKKTDNYGTKKEYSRLLRQYKVE